MRRKDTDRARLARLRSVELFEGCDDDEMERIDGLLTPVAVEAGTTLVSEGAAGLQFVVIDDGWALVERAGRVLGAIGPGSFFGEVALLSNVPRTATVSAVTDMQLFVLHAGEFASLLRAAPTVRARIESVAAERVPPDRIAG